MQSELATGIDAITHEEIKSKFGDDLTAEQVKTLASKVLAAVHANIDTTSTMDAEPRFKAAAAATTTTIVDFFSENSISSPSAFAGITTFRAELASRSTALVEKLRTEYLTGAKGPAPASRFLNKTRGVYEFVRLTLGIKMHGEVNLKVFSPEIQEQSIGQNVSLIHEAIRDGKLQGVVAALFSQA